MKYRGKILIFLIFVLGPLSNKVRCGIWDPAWGRLGVLNKPVNNYQRNPFSLHPLLQYIPGSGPNKIVAREVEDSMAPKIPKKESLAPMTIIHPLVPKQNETEAERAERIHRAFEKMLTLVNIASQVEDYVSSKVKTVVKKVSNLVSSEEDKVSVKHRIKCHNS